MSSGKKKKMVQEEVPVNKRYLLKNYTIINAFHETPTHIFGKVENESISVYVPRTYVRKQIVYIKKDED